MQNYSSFFDRPNWLLRVYEEKFLIEREEEQLQFRSALGGEGGRNFGKYIGCRFFPALDESAAQHDIL